jgi:hypothetical protein
MFVFRFEKAAQQNVRPYAMAGQAVGNYPLFPVEWLRRPPAPAVGQVRWELPLFLVAQLYFAAECRT